MNKPSALILLAALLLSGSSRAQTSPMPQPVAGPSPSAPPTDYTLQWGAKIPMRDNLELNATLYLPKSGRTTPSRTPVIFTLTPLHLR
jgi:predicted acyl esterase